MFGVSATSNELQLGLSGHRQLLQVVHKHLQADIVGDDGRAALALPHITHTSVQHHTNAVELVVVRDGRVDFGQQEAGLRAALVAVDVARHGEPRLQHLHKH